MRPSHQLPTAPAYAHESAGLGSVGRPRRTYSTPVAPSVAKPCISKRLRRLATKAGEKVALEAVARPRTHRWLPILLTGAGLALALLPAGSAAAEKPVMSPATRQLLETELAKPAEEPGQT